MCSVDNVNRRKVGYFEGLCLGLGKLKNLENFEKGGVVIRRGRKFCFMKFFSELMRWIILFNWIFF